MSQAKVRSVEAIESFRANLIVYLAQARPALEEVSAEMLRTRSWLDDEQRCYWEGQMKRRRKELEEAVQALFSARLGSIRHETAAEQMAVHRAKRLVDEADLKLRTLKRWRRDFDGRVQPMVKQVEKLQTVLTNDMVKALAYLFEAINHLAAYAEVQAPGAPATLPPTAAGGSPPAIPSETLPAGGKS